MIFFNFTWPRRGRRFGAILALICALAACPDAAKAQSLQQVFSGVANALSDTLNLRPQDVTNLSLGLGPAVVPRFDGSREYKIRPVPVVSLRYRDVLKVDNNDVDFTAFDKVFGEDSAVEGRLSLGPVVNLDFGRSEKDSTKLKGLGNIGMSVELGAFVEFAAEEATFHVEVGQDVAQGHKGAVMEFTVTRSLYHGDKLVVGANGVMTLATANYMNTFFGVNAAQSAASGLPQFHAGPSIKDIGLSLNAIYALNKHWSVLATLGYRRLLGDAEDSPLVRLRGDSGQGHFSSFLIYTF